MSEREPSATCPRLVLYASPSELDEAERTAMSDRGLITIRLGGWDEMRLAADLDALLMSNIAAHEQYGLAPRYGEAAIANVEWVQKIISPGDRVVRARWMVSAPMLRVSVRPDNLEAHFQEWWRIILHDIAAYRLDPQGGAISRLGAVLRMALWLPSRGATAPMQSVRDGMDALRRCLDALCRTNPSTDTAERDR